MNSFSRLILVLLCLMLLIPSAACGSHVDPRLARMLHSTVSVELQVGPDAVNDWAVMGSGVIVDTASGRMLLTAEHVLMDRMMLASPIRVCSAASIDTCVALDIGLSVVDWDTSMSTDWGLLPLPSDAPKIFKPAKVAKTFPDMGSNLMTLGYPKGTGPWLAEGTVAMLGQSSIVGVDMGAVFGASGSGVWNQDGRLVGIVSAIMANREQVFSTHTFVLRVEAIPFIR